MNAKAFAKLKVYSTYTTELNKFFLDMSSSNALYIKVSRTQFDRLWQIQQERYRNRSETLPTPNMLFEGRMIDGNYYGGFYVSYVDSPHYIVDRS